VRERSIPGSQQSCVNSLLTPRTIAIWQETGHKSGRQSQNRRRAYLYSGLSPFAGLSVNGDLKRSASKETIKMSITIHRYQFEGPFSLDDLFRVQDQSGVYCILTHGTDSKLRVVDVGESGHLRTRLACHDRKTCWSRNESGGLLVAVRYCGVLERTRVEEEIRQNYMPPCGVR
jgi:hypothetical protein